MECLHWVGEASCLSNQQLITQKSLFEHSKVTDPLFHKAYLSRLVYFIKMKTDTRIIHFYSKNFYLCVYGCAVCLYEREREREKEREENTAKTKANSTNISLVMEYDL